MNRRVVDRIVNGADRPLARPVLPSIAHRRKELRNTGRARGKGDELGDVITRGFQRTAYVVRCLSQFADPLFDHGRLTVHELHKLYEVKRYNRHKHKENDEQDADRSNDPEQCRLSND